MTDPTVTALVESIAAELERHADPERAVQAKRYLKSELSFLGVGTPAVRRITKEFLGRQAVLDRPFLLALVDALWRPGVHELRAVALEALVAHLRLLLPEDLRLVEALLRESRSWAYVDALAVHVAGRLVARHAELAAALDRWAGDADFWVRRAALLALLEPLRHGGGDLERFARFADAMLEEREFFIRKAIGWVLREIGRKRPELVEGFLGPRLDRVAGLTLREGVKHLPAGRRDALRAARAGRRPPGS
jgi:3-methyladenine DNA glycosylase AlkD